MEMELYLSEEEILIILRYLGLSKVMEVEDQEEELKFSGIIGVIPNTMI